MKYYITTAIDYLNGKPHIGHAYEKVAADVLARLHRLGGDDVFFLTGTDEHGAKVAAAAEKAGKEPKEYVDELASHFKETWDHLNLSYDRFIRTTDKDHIVAVEKVMNLMKESDALYEAEYEGLYCVGHEAFITEKELADGLCPEHQTKPEIVKEKNWFLKISAYKEKLRDKIESGEFVIYPEESKKEYLSLLADFKDIAITRPNVKWGIPVPWSPEETVYVWPDALTNYISGIGYPNDMEQFNKYWPADSHIVGRDIAKFHCIIWPTILMAAGIKLPEGVYVHGFFTLNGKKMSKSLGNVIDPNEWISKYGSDAVRYFLMREIPFNNDGDVSEEKLKARYVGDLANGLGNLVLRLTNMIEKYCDGKIPEIIRAVDIQEAKGSTINLEEVESLINGYKFHQALQVIWESVAWANEYIDQTKPWELAKTDQEKVNKILSELAAVVYEIAKKLAPFMPVAADKIRKALESEKIVKMEPLFPKAE